MNWPMRFALAAVCLVVAADATAPFAKPADKKVLVIGIDGMDPKLLTKFMDKGVMPNFKQLATEGDFKPLQTSMPPQSPVAWSTFITGMGAGGHGIYDFIHRDPDTLIPYLSMSHTEGPSHVVPINLAAGGCDRWQLPLDSGEVTNLRKGKAFWELLGDHEVSTTMFQMPVNYPPDEFATHALSGMGTPDIRGTSGTFSFYTNRPVPNSEDISGGNVYLVSVVDNVVEARLYGPQNALCEVKKRSVNRRSRTGERVIEYESPEMTVPFQVYIDPDEPVARFVVGDEEFILREGEWSDWVEVNFEAVPLLVTVGSVGRFYLKEARPDFKLYVSPLQISPAAPVLPLTQPESWSQTLFDNLGYFYTQEIPQDTKAYTGGVLDAHEFWHQSQFIREDSDKALEYLLKDFKKGLLFFYYSSVDQGSHMLWHFMDEEHPGYVEDEVLKDGIETLYRQMDDMLGRVRKTLDDDDTLVIMSDHGFGPFYWEVNLNTWLYEQGYVVLKDPARQGQMPFFGNVDWTRTRAYALGLNGLYVNLEGRESRGIVKSEDYQKLLDEIERKLLDLVDPATRKNAVTLIVQSRRDLEGPYADQGPDILVGYNDGFRSSWTSPLGEFPRGVFHDNLDVWSGTHLGDYRHWPGVLLSNRKITLESPALYDLTVAILDEYGIPKLDVMVGQDCLGPKTPGTSTTTD